MLTIQEFCIIVACLVLAWALIELPMPKWLASTVAVAILSICAAMPAKADQGQMSQANYPLFKDVFMVGQCLRIGQATEADAVAAIGTMERYDSRSVDAAVRGPTSLALYLGSAMTNDLVDTRSRFSVMTDDAQSLYCKIAIIRVFEHR